MRPPRVMTRRAESSAGCGAAHLEHDLHAVAVGGVADPLLGGRDRQPSRARSAPIVRASSRRNGSVSVATTSAAPAALAMPTAQRPIGPQPVTSDRPPLDRLHERGVDGVAHRLLQGDDRGVQPVRLDRVRLRDDDALGEAAIGVDADDAQVAAEVHVPSAALSAGPVEEVALDADEVALPDASDALAGPDHGACQLVPEHPRWFEVLRGPVVPVEEVEVRAADARSIDAEEHLARPRRRSRPLDELRARTRPDLGQRPHRADVDGRAHRARAASAPTPDASA